MSNLSERRMYAILHHQQGRLEHWDLVFEMPGEELLRTFQLFAAPEAEAARRGIPCRETAPHRRRYLVFEGEISGGRGQVKQWDSGTLVVLAESPKLIRMQLESSQKKGAFANEARRVYPEWVMHAQGGGDWKLRAAAELPVAVDPIHMPHVHPPVDPLRRRVFRDGV